MNNTVVRNRVIAIRVAVAASIVAVAGMSCGTLALAEQPPGVPLDAKPLVVAPDMQKRFEKDFGTEEVVRLQHDLDSSLRYARKKTDPAACVNGAVSLETTLVDAKPNHPTMQQMTRQTGLDYIRSVSVGGAELSGVLKAADGHVVATIPYKSYAMDIRDARMSGDTWGDASKSIDAYARLVAKSCRGAH